MEILLKRALALAALAVLCSSSAISTTAPFILTIEAEQNPVKVGSEVKIAITLRNSSNRLIYMSQGLTELDYSFEVRDSQNKVPPETDFAREAKGRAHFWNDTVFPLQPGETLPKEVLAVTKFYDLSRPGRYTVQVSRTAPKELGGGMIKSNTITITVTERMKDSK